MGGPLARLMNEEADLIVASLEGVPVHDVEILPIGSITVRPVAHPDFEPARAVRIHPISEMQAYVQVVVADTGGGDYEQSRDLLPGGRRWTVSDFEMKKSVILAGHGWGGLPDHLIREELDSGALVPLNVEGFPPRHTEIYAIRRKDKAMGRVLTELWRALAEL